MRVPRRTVFAFSVAILAFATASFADDSAPAPAFDARRLRAYRSPGSASLLGALVVSVAGGSAPIVAAHARVIAVPDSAYTRWWFETTNAALGTQSGPFADPPDDPKLAPFEKTTYTDDMGNFRFDGLPAGEYRVRGRVDATFDRTVSAPHDVKTVGVDGSSIVTTEVITKTFHDRSAFWLESGLVRLAQTDSKAITLYVAVRRNIYGRR
jgi:hypothetical protein